MKAPTFTSIELSNLDRQQLIDLLQFKTEQLVRARMVKEVKKGDIKALMDEVEAIQREIIKRRAKEGS